jgi:general secretion pathway protein J
MQVATWLNNSWRQGGVDPGANAAGTVQAQPQPQPDQAVAQVNNEPTGLQVALQSQNLQQPMVKSFLLGEP